MGIDWENYSITEFDDVDLLVDGDDSVRVFISRQVDTAVGEEFWFTIIDKNNKQFDGRSIKREKLEEIKTAIEMLLEIEKGSSL